jgi:hypothetical protein
MAESSTPAPGGTPPAKGEVELLEILQLLIESKKARTTADLLKYASQYGAPQAEERLRLLEAENIPLASRAAAWALGAGICAGSSSLITAASAGIILAEESQRFNDPDHAITFQRYLAFGLPFSLFMLLFYAVYFTAVR